MPQKVEDLFLEVFNSVTRLLGENFDNVFKKGPRKGAMPFLAIKGSLGLF